MTVSAPQLARLTAAKAIANTALRWPPFFLFELEAAFNTDTSTLTSILGVAEMTGLITLFVGSQLDAGRERRFMTGALALISVSALASLTGSLAVLAGAFVALGCGSSLMTVGGHTYLSQRVPAATRSRYIGTFEVSWASALLIGAPVVSILLTRFGWRAPFIAIAIAAGLFTVITARDSDTPPTERVARQTNQTDDSQRSLDARAWMLIVASGAISIAGFATIVITGTWLKDDFGLSTERIGALVFALGAAELVASVGSATFADRLGPLRTTQIALGAAIGGATVMSQAGGSLALGFVGLFLFLLGFEYSIVTSFAFVSESAPSARGKALSINNAFGTLLRGAGAVASGFLYEAFGVRGSVALTIVAAVVAVVLLVVARSPRSESEVLSRDLDPTFD